MRNTHPREVQFYITPNDKEPFTEWFQSIREPNMRKMRKWRDVLIEQLAADREVAIGFLQAVLEDYQTYDNPAALASALRAVVESRGGISELAKQIGIEPQILSKALLSEKAPRIDTLGTILNALGCKLSIAPLGNEDSASDLELSAKESAQLKNAQTQLSESDSP